VSESVEALAEKVRGIFRYVEDRSGHNNLPAARAALDALLARLAEAEEQARVAEWAMGVHRKMREAAEAERDRYRDALRKSAEALHGLGEDPVHLRNIFAECPDHHCVAARAALDQEQP
jgi:hypothetical protein